MELGTISAGHSYVLITLSPKTANMMYHDITLTHCSH